VAEADWVFEAAPERLELKQALFERIDRAAPPSAVLATNTSVIRPSEIAARAANRGRIIGTHWWSPPYLVPLVEVVQAEETTTETVERTISLLSDLGKTAVHVRRDVAGFVGNRLQHALWREAFLLIDAGVCDPETIDTVVKSSFGRRLGALGPIENADLIGLDLTLDIHDYLLPRLDPPSEPSAGLQERVARGELGAKSSVGYLPWTEQRADETRERVRLRLLDAAAE
jgi:3-hydroxybutyryl-CoA dehydrogenase